MTPSRVIVVATLVSLACRIAPEPGTLPPHEGSIDPPQPDEPPRDSSASAGSQSVAAGTGARGEPPVAGGGQPGVTDGPSDACHAQAVSLDEVREQAVVAGVPVELVATATSQKFLVSESEDGRCLWGAFVGDEPVDGKPRGVLVISYGDESTSGRGCPSGSDAVPDDLAPGDVVRVVGRASSFAPAACGTLRAAPQLVSDARCPFELLARADAPSPVVLPTEVADELVRGSEPSLFYGWIGGLVRLEDVSALPNETGDGAVRPYGVLALAETTLEVHADIEYADLGGAGPRDPEKGLDFPYPTRFRSITGLLYLDYCTFALGPRRRCEDFDPPSANCP